jgi:hypothetical protein
VTEQERIEGINSEQLATATDRMLLAARFGRARPNLYARGSTQISSQQWARGSATHLAPPTQFAQGLARASTHRIADDKTVFTRRPKHYRSAWRKFTTTALVTSLISVATAIALLV